MEINQILKEVNEIFIDVLDDKSIVLKPETKADDIEEWDSLNNIQLVVAVERKFKIKFASSQIQNWKNVGEMCQSIADKLNN